MDLGSGGMGGMPGEGAPGVAVFARNEAASLGGCLRAIAAAVDGTGAEVSVVLNGTTDDSAAVAERAMRGCALRGRVWLIPHGDKSNAINQYLHALCPRAPLHVMVDGYAVVEPDAIRRLSARLARAPSALAAAAVPGSGRGAEAVRRDMLAHPKLHGSLFALRGRFVERLAEAGLRLPVGLYRGDGLLGSFVMHALDATGSAWNPERVAVEPRATWTVRPLQPWRPGDVRRQLRRLVQQARGRLESAAIRHVIYREGGGGFAALPPHADRLILDWLAAEPSAAPSPMREPLAAVALRRVHRAARPTAADLLPRLAATVGA